MPHRGIGVILNGDRDAGIRISVFDLDVQDDEKLYQKLRRPMGYRDEGIIAEEPSAMLKDQGGLVRFFGEVSLDKMWPKSIYPADEYVGNEPADEELTYHHVALLVSLASHPFAVAPKLRRSLSVKAGVGDRELGKPEYHKSHIKKRQVLGFGNYEEDYYGLYDDF